MTDWKLDHMHLGEGYIRAWFISRSESGTIYQSCYYTPNYPCPPTSSNQSLLQLSLSSPSRYAPQHRTLSIESSQNGTQPEPSESKMQESRQKLEHLAKVKIDQLMAAMKHQNNNLLRLVEHPTEDDAESIERINRIYQEIEDETTKRVREQRGIIDAEFVDVEDSRGRGWPAFTDDGYRPPVKQKKEEPKPSEELRTFTIDTDDGYRPPVKQKKEEPKPSIEELRTFTVEMSMQHQSCVPWLEDLENPEEDNESTETTGQAQEEQDTKERLESVLHAPVCQNGGQ